MRSKRRKRRRRKTRRKRGRGVKGRRNPRAQKRRDEERLEVAWDGKPYTAKTPIQEKRKTLKKSRGNLTSLMRRDSDKSIVASRARKLSAENKNRPGILRDELRRKEDHARVQEAAKELTIGEFEKMIIKKPSIKLDEAILIFEKAPRGQTLEEFAEGKMRTARSYRNTFNKEFNTARRRTEHIWASGAANLPIMSGSLRTRRGNVNDNRVLALNPRSRFIKDTSNLAYFNTTRKKRGGRRSRRRRRGGKSPPPGFKSKSEAVYPPVPPKTHATRSQTKKAQEAAQDFSGLSLMQIAMAKARRKRFQKMANSKKQEDRGAAGGRRRSRRR